MPGKEDDSTAVVSVGGGGGLVGAAFDVAGAVATERESNGT